MEAASPRQKRLGKPLFTVDYSPSPSAFNAYSPTRGTERVGRRPVVLLPVKVGRGAPYAERSSALCSTQIWPCYDKAKAEGRLYILAHWRTNNVSAHNTTMNNTGLLLLCPLPGKQQHQQQMLCILTKVNLHVYTAVYNNGCVCIRPHTSTWVAYL